MTEEEHLTPEQLLERIYSTPAEPEQAEPSLIADHDMWLHVHHQATNRYVLISFSSATYERNPEGVRMMSGLAIERVLSFVEEGPRD